MQLSVIFMYDTSKWRTIPLDDIKDTETVENVKKIILESTGISVKLQRLIFEGMEMEDDRPLNFYNVKEKSTVYLMRGERGGSQHLTTACLMVSNAVVYDGSCLPRRNRFTLDLKTPRLLISGRRELCSHRNFTDKLRLSVNYILKRERFYLDDIKDIESVENVKKIITDVEGVPVEHQRLVFKGTEMEDGRPLSFYNVDKNSTVHLMLGRFGGRKMRLFVNNLTKERSFTLDNIKDTETVKNVKKIVADAEDMPVYFEWKLFSLEWGEMENDRMLFSYNLLQKDKYVLNLVVWRRAEGETINLAPPDPAVYYGNHKSYKYLAEYYNVNKKICRKCSGRLPLNATHCRKARCGRTHDIRWKKRLFRWEPPITKTLNELRLKA